MKNEIEATPDLQCNNEKKTIFVECITTECVWKQTKIGEIFLSGKRIEEKDANEHHKDSLMCTRENINLLLVIGINRRKN